MSSSDYETINYYFNVKGWWTVEMVKDAVVKGVLTPEEFRTITKQDYHQS